MTWFTFPNKKCARYAWPDHPDWFMITRTQLKTITNSTGWIRNQTNSSRYIIEYFNQSYWKVSINYNLVLTVYNGVVFSFYTLSMTSIRLLHGFSNSKPAVILSFNSDNRMGQDRQHITDQHTQLVTVWGLNIASIQKCPLWSIGMKLQFDVALQKSTSCFAWQLIYAPLALTNT